MEGEEGQAGRRSSAVQKAKAALEQLQGEHRVRMCPARAFWRLRGPQPVPDIEACLKSRSHMPIT